MKSVAATPRTVAAIRKADALPTVIPGGKMEKGKIYGSGDTYNGYFKPSASGAVVTIAAGKVVIGGTVIDTASTNLTIAAAAWIYVEVTYAAGYLASVKQAASYPAPVEGTWKRVIATATLNGTNASVVRQQAGPVHYEG